MSVMTPCPEDIPSETLSVWGDGGLPEAEAARLRAHVAGCPACQERLRAFSDVNRLVSGQRIPTAPPVDIAAVRAGRSRQSAPRHLGRRSIPRTVWGGLGAAVAAALLIAAFSQVFARLGPITPATATATATRPTIKTLVWSQRTMPPGISLARYPINFSTQASYEMNFAISHASSQNGWVCALAPDGTVTIWATTDQARTWRRIGSITPPPTPAPINGCYLVPDQVSPITLAVYLTWGDGAKGTLQMESYISGNDGQTWTSLGSVSTPALATIGKRTYVGGITISRQSPHTRLMVSDDGFRTWRDITPASPTFRLMTGLWPDPASGALLLGSGRVAEASTQLWRSDDGGATWTQYDPKYEVYMGAWISAAHHWRLCARPSMNIASYMCTDDLGKTWNPVPTPSALTVCSDCGRDGAPDTLQAACPGVTPAIALDGSLLSDCLAPGSYTKATLPAPMVYRLAPGSTAWKDIGPISGPWRKDTGFEYSAMFITADPSSSAGALWYADPVAKALAVGVLPS